MAHARWFLPRLSLRIWGSIVLRMKMPDGQPGTRFHKSGLQADEELYHLTIICRQERIYYGEITLREGDPEGEKSPTYVGTGKAKEEKVPLSEIIKVLNERFCTNFTDEDRFFFEQSRENATSNEQVVKLRHATASCPKPSPRFGRNVLSTPPNSPSSSWVILVLAEPSQISWEPQQREADDGSCEKRPDAESGHFVPTLGTYTAMLPSKAKGLSR